MEESPFDRGEENRMCLPQSVASKFCCNKIEFESVNDLQVRLNIRYKRRWIVSGAVLPVVNLRIDMTKEGVCRQGLKQSLKMEKMGILYTST